MMMIVQLLLMEIRLLEIPIDEVKNSLEILCSNEIYEKLFLVSMTPHKPGSITGSTGKSKLMRRSSVKLRKPSLRIKDSGKRK